MLVQKTFNLCLNLESACVLLRCLEYGENAVSQVEVSNGTATVIQENVNLLRKQLCSEIYDWKLQETYRDTTNF